MSLFSCRKWKVMRNFGLVRSFDYEFFNGVWHHETCDVNKLDNKSTAISALCLHYAVLGSWAELEPLKRGLQNTKLTTLNDKHAHLFKELFLHSQNPITADSIQDVCADYSDRGSISRVEKEAIMMQELEGACISKLCNLNWNANLKYN